MLLAIVHLYIFTVHKYHAQFILLVSIAVNTTARDLFAQCPLQSM
jgi:hypothetical protein